jgi:hypothetical protein
MRIWPTSNRTCNVHYDVFRHRDCTDELYKSNHEFFVQVRFPFSSFFCFVVLT